MKIAFLIVSFFSSLSWAKVEVAVDCQYGPTANNLVVATDWESYQLGYRVMDEFFSIQASGCKQLSVQSDQLYCDQLVLGSIGEFVSYKAINGEPQASLTILKERHVKIVGSCDLEKKQPLILEVID